MQKIFESYMSRGSVTEIVHFFVREYNERMKVSSEGGIADEEEYIEVLELGFDEAFDIITPGEIKDGKTIMLLQHVKFHGLMN